MPRPLTWNMPGLYWGKPGATWNGVVGDLEPMSKVKAIIDFSGYAAADLAPAAQNIHTKITANAATFPTLPVSMAELATLIEDFEMRLAAKASRAIAAMIAFDIARHELEGALGELGELGVYVNGVAKGDAAIVEKSGFPSYATGHVISDTPPAAPENLRLRDGNVSGEVVARYRPDRDKSMNEVQKCVGDPNLETNWVHVGMFSGGKATIGGIAPGTHLWVRVRTCGNKGAMGDWSDPAEIWTR